MSKSRILITGSEGLIGNRLLNYLKGKYEIDELDIKKGVNILDKKKVEEKVKDVNGVIHLAAATRVINAYYNPLDAIETNVLGTAIILDTIRKINPSCWFIFGSSREVYGESLGKTREIDQLNPLNVYGSTKLACESICTTYRKNYSIKTFITRYSNVYGAKNDHPGRVIPIFFNQALTNSNITVNGGNQSFDFMHVDDLVTGLSILIEKIISNSIPDQNYKFHFVTGIETTLIELAEKIIKTTNSKSVIKYMPARNFDVERFVGDPTLVNKILGWSAKISLDDGLKKYKTELERA